MDTPKNILTSTHLDKLASESWVLVENAFPRETLDHLLSLFQKEGPDFRPAKVGAANQEQQESSIRGDAIRWLSSDRDSHKSILDQLEQLKKELREGLRVSLDDFECHLAVYPPGAGYNEHIDQSPQRSLNTTRRVYSFVLYLNESWTSDQGGQLVLRLPHSTEVILPHWNRLVIFSSTDLPHRVEKSYSPRRSLTGWMRRCSNPFHGESAR
ncbi:MAG: 2OG-Fe(II) oxygenase [Proteobacteria bacterium]|nr:2OG-Fe(II) oxygenase [Pseudomonadota bacterium]